MTYGCSALGIGLFEVASANLLLVSGRAQGTIETDRQASAAAKDIGVTDQMSATGVSRQVDALSNQPSLADFPGLIRAKLSDPNHLAGTLGRLGGRTQNWRWRCVVDGS
jgi:hypothetical protein